MTRVRDIPVHDSTRVRDVRVASEEAGAHAGLDAHRTAVAALVATEPAVVAATIPRDAGSAASPVRDDTRVAVLAADHPAGRL